MKKLLVLVVVVAMVAAMFVGCSAPQTEEPATDDAAATEEPAADDAAADDAAADDTAAADGDITIGVTLMDYQFAFYQDMLAMMKKTADELGVTLVDVDGAGDVQTQLTAVEDLIYAKNVDAIVMCPVDTEAISTATLEANEAGIPVVTVDVRSADGEVVSHVASDNYQIGVEAAKYTEQLLTEKYGEVKGTVACVGYPQITTIKERADGFTEYFKDNANVEIVVQDPISLDPDTAQGVGDDLLQAYPEGKLDVIFGANETNAVGVISAAESANRTDIQVIGVDNSQVFLDALQTDTSVLVATIAQAPTEMGRIGIETAVAYLKGESYEEEVGTELTLITRDTVADYIASQEELQESIASYKAA